MLTKKDISNTLIYSCETIVSGVLSILFYIMLANYLSMAELGVYSLVLVYTSLLANLANFGLVSGYERNYFEIDPNDITKAGSLLASVQFFSMVFLLVFAILAIYFKDYIAINFLKNANYSMLWITVIIGSFSSEFGKFYLTYLRNTNQAKIYSLLHLIQVIINFTFSYLFLVIFNKGILWVGISLMVSHCCVLFLCFWHQIRLLPIIINFALFRAVLKISIPLTPRAFIGLLATQFDKLILSVLGSLDSLGVYSVAQRLAVSIAMLMNAFGKVYQPKLYRLLFARGNKEDFSFISVYMFYSLIPALFLILFAKEIFLLFPEDYRWGYKILVLLCCYYAILYVGKINGPQLLFAKKTWLISGLSFANVLINISITYYLVLLYGAVGAAAGTFVSTLLINVISFYFSQKYAPINWDYGILFFCYVYIGLCTFFILNLDDLVSIYLVNLSIKIIILFIFGYVAYFLGIYKIDYNQK